MKKTVLLFMLTLLLFMGTVVPSFALGSASDYDSLKNNQYYFSYNGGPESYDRHYFASIPGSFSILKASDSWQIYFTPNDSSAPLVTTYYAVKGSSYSSQSPSTRRSGTLDTSGGTNVFCLDIVPLNYNVGNSVNSFNCVVKHFEGSLGGSPVSVDVPPTVSNFNDGMTIVSPSKGANIIASNVNVSVYVKVPISSTFQKLIKGAILDVGRSAGQVIGQGCYIYATSDKCGSQKFYSTNSGDMGKEGFRESDIVEVTSSYYLVRKNFSIPNDASGQKITVKAHMPTDNLLVWSNYKDYTASVSTVNDSSLPADDGGTDKDSNGIFTPPDRGNYSDDVWGSVQFALDWIIFVIKLPFQLIAQLFSITANGLSSIMTWLTNVIGFMTKLFSFAPQPVVICLGALMTVATVFAIFRIFRR